MSPFTKPSSFAPPSVLPDISPSKGEIGSFAWCAYSTALTIGETQADGLIYPLEGEMSGRTEGGAKERHNIRPATALRSEVANRTGLAK